MKTTLFAVSFAALAVTVFAQAPQPDFSKVEIKTTKISNNFYSLEGQGGTIGVLVGPDGIFMVDSQFAPLSQKIAAAIHQISDQPIRFMVNTHVHGDHTGGNENFAKMGTTIFARDELRFRLAHPSPGANGAPGIAAPAVALPVVTYEGPVTIHMDGEDVHLIPIPKAHTDGDTLVYFPNNDVLMTGDYFRSIQFPNIDRANGGSLSGMIEGLGVTIGIAGPHTKIIPGHGPMVDRAAVIAHRDMILSIRDKVAAMVHEGKTVEEVLAAKPTSDYDSIPNASATSERFVGQLYAELKTN
jgi:glyoxylase-like metal-dependent hydrolase (beta-lactamase superfamily II)